MIVPGIVSATFKTRSVEDVLSITKKAGLAAIEWSENHHLPKGDLAFAERVSSLTKESGLEIAGYGSYYRLGQGMDIRPSIDTALALGTNNVRIWAGGKASDDLERGERDSLLSELREAVSIAERNKVVLNLEWHKNTLTDKNQSGLDVLSSLSSPLYSFSLSAQDNIPRKNMEKCCISAQKHIYCRLWKKIRTSARLRRSGMTSRF